MGYKINNKEHNKNAYRELEFLKDLANKYSAKLLEEGIDITPVIYVRSYKNRFFPNMEFRVPNEELRYTFNSKGKLEYINFFEFLGKNQIPLEEAGANEILQKINKILITTFSEDYTI